MGDRKDPLINIVSKWNKLACDPVNQAAMGRHSATMKALTRHIKNNNYDVSIMSLKIIELLSCNPQNRPIFVQNDDLVNTLKELMSNEDTKISSSAKTSLIYLGLYRSSDASYEKEYTTTTFGLDHKLSAGQYNLLEKRIIDCKGVISVTSYSEAKTVVVTINTSQCKIDDIANIIKNFEMDSVGLEAPQVPIIETKQLNPPKSGPHYLDDDIIIEQGPAAITMYGFDSLETRVENKLKADQDREEKTTKIQGFLSRFSRAVTSFL